MNPIVICAESALRAHPRPAVPISELVELVAPRIDRSLGVDRLRAILEEYPDRFRVLEPFPARRLRRHGATLEPDEVSRIVVESEAWAAWIGEPGEPPDAPKVALRLRESVRWLTRGIDTRSTVEVRRWYVIVLSERAASAPSVDRAA
jgi:hypothetical protein